MESPLQISLRGILAVASVLSVYFASLGGAFGEPIRMAATTCTLVLCVVTLVVVIQLLVFTLALMMLAVPAGIAYWTLNRLADLLSSR